ncbi:hypothetical protein HPB48_013247 [Haemaphysalis longicornis]|uniref:Uncharacterized protein n=1 Tax=Haemaphysalis longicornis TaxID=44386 RepID=A0A9J6GYM5_HAELO|nr:hypothetical protein HPB48_013247 [Haemaphysalis longicornis]
MRNTANDDYHDTSSTTCHRDQRAGIKCSYPVKHPQRAHLRTYYSGIAALFDSVRPSSMSSSVVSVGPSHSCCKKLGEIHLVFPDTKAISNPLLNIVCPELNNNQTRLRHRRLCLCARIFPTRKSILLNTAVASKRSWLYVYTLGERLCSLRRITRVLSPAAAATGLKGAMSGTSGCST